MSSIYYLGTTDVGQASTHSNGSAEYLTQPREIKWKPNYRAKIIQIACTSNYTLFLTDDGKVYTSSSTDNKDTATTTTTTAAPATATTTAAPKIVTELDRHVITQISAGKGHSLALTEWGQLYSWGSNEFGQLGMDGPSRQVATPKLVKTIAAETVVQIASGHNHTLALTNCGKLYAWGANLYGQLGIAPPLTKPSSSFPKIIDTLTGIPIAHIACGSNHSFAIVTTGAVFGWGCNNRGQLGLNDMTNRCFPQELKTMRHLGVRYVACGDKFSVFLTEGGGVLTCGCGMYGQLGHGGSENEGLPRMVMELMGTPIAQVACGMHHTLALTSNNGRLYGFGLDCYGQMGERRNKNTAVPEYVYGPWLPMGESLSKCKPGTVCIRQIFAGGFRSFITSAQPNEHLSPLDYRQHAPKTQISQLTYELAKQCAEAGKTKSLDLELLYTVELVFRSQACWNASFFVRSKSVRLFPQHNICLPEAMEAFRLFNLIENDTMKSAIWDKVIYELIPALNAAPTDVESLRIYMLLPLYYSFENPENYSTVHTPFSQKILELDNFPKSVIWQWWSETPIDWFEQMVKNFKKTVEHLITLQACPIIPNNSTSKRIIVYDPNLEAALELLLLLYEINRNGREQKLSYESFYISKLTEYTDIQTNFINWMSKNSPTASAGNCKCQNFNICSYTFLFNASAKTILLETDQGLQMAAAMEVAANANLIARCIYGEPISEFVTLEVARESLVEDALREILAYTPRELKKPLRVKFKGEEAEDAGGVRKEFFMLLLKEILDPKFGMFKMYDSRCIWFADSTFETEDMYFLIGVICGLAIYNYTIINLSFPLALYKKLLNAPVHLADLAELSPVVARSLQELLDYEGEDVEEVFGLNFEIARDVFGNTRMIPLKPNGNLCPVTQNNKQEFVDLYVDFMLNQSVDIQFKSFKKGFAKVCWGCVLQVFEPEELMALIVGNEKYDWKVLEQNCAYKNGYTAEHPTIKIFWKVFHELGEVEKKNFLLYLTGSDRIPIHGMQEIPICIQPTGDERFLPVAYTCFNLLDLPLYTSEEQLKSKLLQAIEYPHGFSLV